MARYRDWLIGRWVGLMLVFVFVGALLLPTGAVARVEYTDGGRATEGDPTDGLDADGGGGGGTFNPDESETFVPLVVTVYPVPSLAYSVVVLLQNSIGPWSNFGPCSQRSYEMYRPFIKAGEQR